MTRGMAAQPTTRKKNHYEAFSFAFASCDTLTATYTVTAGGETHTVSLTMNAKYTYENIQPVTAPADADSYKDVSFDEIVGE